MAATPSAGDGAEFSPRFGVVSWQHLALSVFASVELRTDLVRAVNSAVSAYIDPNGRLAGKTSSVDPYANPRAAERALFRLVLLPCGETFYARFGNVFVFACLALLLAMAVLSTMAAPARGTSPQTSV